jgi:hypothetical protein
MNFMPAAWQTRRARVAMEQWNAENPDCWVPWEWVEEVLLAWRAWKEQTSYAPQDAMAHHQRYQEFVGKLPSRLVTEIFPQVS